MYKRTLQNIFLGTLLVSILLGCGGSSSSGQTTPAYSISGNLNGMDNIRSLVLSLNSENFSISQNGNFSFNRQLGEGDAYELDIERKPARQDCTIANGTGVVGQNNVNDIAINCADDESAPLFSLDRLHKIRLTMTYEEWKAFELDTLRSNYSINDASGPALTWTSWTHSEIYRQADFDYLDDQGVVLGSVPKVGFKMQGNTSRQYPVDYESNPAQPSLVDLALPLNLMKSLMKMKVSMHASMLTELQHQLDLVTTLFRNCCTKYS